MLIYTLLLKLRQFFQNNAAVSPMWIALPFF
jgi:hypothetical protein